MKNKGLKGPRQNGGGTDRDWYKIEALDDGARRVKINIHAAIAQPAWWEDKEADKPVGARAFIRALDELDVDDIDLHINSPGGEVFEGIAIYNALRAHKAAVHVTVDGMAASIASVVAMAGDDVRMPATAMMMIHDPSGLVFGTPADMAAMAEALGKVKGAILAAYTAKTEKLSAQKIADMMARETWITAEEAVEWGFADEMVTDAPAVAAFLPPVFTNFYKSVPARLIGNAPAPVARAGGKTRPGTERRADEMRIEELTREGLERERPELCDAIRAEAAAAAQAAVLALAGVHFGDTAGAAFAKVVASGATAEMYAAIRDAAPAKESGAQAAALAAIAAAGAPAVGSDLPPPGGEKSFDTLVAEEMAAKKCKKSEAMKAVRARDPKAYESWLRDKQAR